MSDRSPEERAKAACSIAQSRLNAQFPGFLREGGCICGETTEAIREAMRAVQKACITAILDTCIVCGGTGDGEVYDVHDGQEGCHRCEYCGRPGDVIRKLVF